MHVLVYLIGILATERMHNYIGNQQSAVSLQRQERRPQSGRSRDGWNGQYRL